MNSYTHPMSAKGPTFVGSKLVYPGETVLTDAPMDEAADAGIGSPAARDLHALQAGTIKEIEPELPLLSLSELEALTEIEQKSAQPRLTLIEKIGAETLKRRAGAGEG